MLELKHALERAAKHYNAHRTADAEIIYEDILRVTPNEPTALHRLGLIAHWDGKNELAAQLITKATAVGPNNAEAHYDLGVVYQELGRFEDAITCYNKSLSISPDNSVTHNNLGTVLRETGDLEEAVSCYRKAIDIEPNYSAAHSNLGLAYQELGKLTDALDQFGTALKITGNTAEIHYNHGNVLQELGRLAEAVNSYEAALDINPKLVEANTNLGLTLRDLGRVEDARDHYLKALAIDPNLGEARYSLGMLQLSVGEMEQGWKNYEWRWKKWSRNANDCASNKPIWRGDALKDRTIYIYPEQGLGDSICFVRYLPLLRQLGCQIIFEAPSSLASLFRHSRIADYLIETGETPPHFDCHASLLDLPQHLNTRLETIPTITPYLRVPEKLNQEWKARFGEAKTFRVGIAWAGNSNLRQDQFRSATVELFLPLAKLPHVTLYSLQVGAKAGAKTLLNEKIIDCAPHLTDFAQTAAAMTHLDLIISVDTSVAHVAGALGRPVWTLLHSAPDWRWMHSGETTAWYPTMRLFRQAQLGQWDQVSQSISSALSDLTQGTKKNLI